MFILEDIKNDFFFEKCMFKKLFICMYFYIIFQRKGKDILF